MESKNATPGQDKEPMKEVERKLSKKKMLLSGLVFIGLIIASAFVINYFFNRRIDGLNPSASSESIKEETKANKQVCGIEHKGYRLPLNLEPLNYTIRLVPFLNGNLTVHGHVEIEILVVKTTKVVILHAQDLVTVNHTAKIVKKGTTAGGGIKIVEQTYCRHRHFYMACLDANLDEGSVYTFSVDFKGILASSMLGFYWASYIDEHGNDRRVGATQFEPSFARMAFPCFDEPAMKTNFTIEIAREKNMSSLSNMPRAQVKPVVGVEGWLWDIYETSVKMPTYLVAFVVSDFVSFESPVNSSSKFSVWGREQVIENAEYSAIIGPQLLSFFEEYFGVPYPLPKMDAAAIPEFTAGAMENWGLMTFREERVLVDEETSSYGHVLACGLLMAHELAHQWFGNLVSPKWWNDIWLNEGFATYMSYIGMNHIEPHKKVLYEFSQITRVAMDADSSDKSHPLRIPVEKSSDALDIFDTITYKKGSSIIRMMSHFLTDETLKSGLNKYLNHLMYKNADQNDLWHFLTLQAHQDATLDSNMTVGAIMNTWTMQMGYPVLNSELLSNGTVVITQKRFILGSEKVSPEEDYKWFIPISYTTGSDPDFNATKPSFWLAPTDRSILLDGIPKNQWVIFNLQQTGYYRVNYHQQNWLLIAKQMEDDHTIIDVRNRAQLMDDSFVLSKSGWLSYNSTLTLLGYIKKERSFIPWDNALKNVDFILRLLGEPLDVLTSMKKYILTLVMPVYEELQRNSDESTGDPEATNNRIKLKLLINNWVCVKLHHEACVQASIVKYRQWMIDTVLNKIPPNDQENVFCASIAKGGLPEWEFMWRYYMRKRNSPEKNDLLAALACTQNETILQRYLEKTLTPDGGILKQDITSVICHVAGWPIGNRVAWDFLRTNWKELLDFIGSSFMTFDKMIPKVTRALKTDEDLNQLKEFKEAYDSHPLGSAVLTERAMQQAQFNHKWVHNHLGDIFQYLFNNFLV